MSQDAHQPEVPRRRRPTASVRRQRVHVTENITQTPEDVPQLNEDVPHVSDATPEMTSIVDAVDAEGVASDGSLGSLVADEGFPGGPRDPSVLTGFAEHIAHSIWSGEERPDLKLVFHGRKVDKFGRPAPEIEGMIAATGLSPLIRCSIITTDPGLISAFVERWHRETNTFHLPVGELTITLDDISSLLHLPITRALHAFEPLVTSDTVRLLTELLEVTLKEATAETRQAGGPHAFRDLAQAGGFSWGVAALVHLYEHLNEASQTPTRQMVGYITLLQCWIYKHFLAVHQYVVDDAYAKASPRASRWLTGQLRWGQIVVYVRLEQDGAEPRHPPTPHDEEFVEPPIPEVPVASDLPTHSVVNCQRCQAFTEDLERVINLRMVTEGTDLYDIMTHCLRIARGDAANGSLRSRQRRRID
ncbi:Protein MAINTENANCE OF MERISTEMS [Glycine max]|nr:Protein MAINTENANCE OF MERISTEMS [Glycine max]